MIGTHGKPDAVEWEADPRHAEIIWKAMKLTSDSKGLSAPGSKSDGPPVEGEDLISTEAETYRSNCMRSLFLALDRPDIVFSAKELSRGMSRPTSNGWAALKRLARYLIKYPRLVWVYRRQEPPRHLDGVGDSNWAGCTATRKSTSSAAVLHGFHLLFLTSTTQAIISLSVGEAEFYALVKLASRLLGTAIMVRELGAHLEAVLATDSSAARGVASRRGAGKIRHIHTPSLWLQQQVVRKTLRVRKIAGARNGSDIGTKHLDQTAIAKCLSELGLEIRYGVPTEALRVAG